MKRRNFISNILIASGGIMGGLSAHQFLSSQKESSNGEAIMPVLFVGHGAPLYTLDDNKYTRAWRKIAQDLPKPKAVVCVSAHWLTRGNFVTAMPDPPTIHDFGRMDDRLFDIQYNAPGDPELAKDITQNMMALHVAEDHEWGLDHGCWCVARAMYPDADVPILQFSIDYHAGGQHQYEVGKQLAFLREKGVLILCSGNIVHNLRQLIWREDAYHDWVLEADVKLAELIQKGDHQSLINYQKLGSAVQLAIPTPDHYYPLITALGLKRKEDQVSFPIEGLSYGGTSMRSVLLS